MPGFHVILVFFVSLAHQSPISMCSVINNNWFHSHFLHVNEKGSGALLSSKYSSDRCILYREINLFYWFLQRERNLLGLNHDSHNSANVISMQKYMDYTRKYNNRRKQRNPNLKMHISTLWKTTRDKKKNQMILKSTTLKPNVF